MQGDEPAPDCLVQGQIKWFDPARGFGFLADSSGGSDVLLHANVLRSFGQSSVADGALVEVRAIATARGRQAIEVVAIQPPLSAGQAPIADLDSLDVAELDALPLLPARVKWFDKGKGFGFANIFGRRGDVFLHVEVLRHWGFADVVPGEAVGLRIIDGPRGMMAAQIVAWDRAANDTLPADETTEEDVEGRADAGLSPAQTTAPAAPGLRPKGAAAPAGSVLGLSDSAPPPPDASRYLNRMRALSHGSVHVLEKPAKAVR